MLNIQRIEEDFFLSPTFQALTIGVPFCIFKLLFGMLAIRAGSGLLDFLGWLIIIWAAIDLFMNLKRVAYHLSGRSSSIEYCSIAQVGRMLKRPKLFLALDTFISFSIICFVLWSGWILLLTKMESYLWYAATTLNLISIAFVNVRLEYQRGT
jgi:hypothetical protein